jgi:hypothetical protein
MSTRGRLGIELADESILSVYCHFDNYPEFNGVKLVEHFNTREKVSSLIDGGDISSLWTNLDGGDMSSCWTDDSFPMIVVDHFTILPEVKILLLVLMLTSMITLLMVRSMLTSTL